MHFLRTLLLLLTLAASAWPPAPPRAAQAAPPAAVSKVAAWVTQHTAAGQEAEFLVVLDQQADLSGAVALPTKQAKGRFVYETLWQTAQATQAPLLAWLTANDIPHRSFYLVNLIWVRGDAGVVQALAARADVARLDGNPEIDNSASGLGRPSTTTAAPNAVEANISYVNADDVWGLGYTGQGVVVGGQDTGYQWDHPALQPHYRGWNGSTADHDYNWHDSIHTGGSVCGADAPVPCDDHNHGTHTMGTAVGDDLMSNQIGMAPGAQWIGCRNMNQGVGTPATYLECFEWFLAPYRVGGTPAQGDPDLAPDVTNNSWGCPPSEGCAWHTLQAAVEAQRAAGIFTVVSAGNLGSAGCSSVVDPPAIYDAAYTVGALMTGTDTIAGLSSRGPVMIDSSQRRKPDIAAPGTGIRSSVRGGGYNLLSGTSMAVPHAVGAVALLWSAQPELRGQIDVTESILNQAAFHLTASACDAAVGWPNNTYGHGRLDVLAAVNLAAGVDTGTLNGAITEKFSDEPVSGAVVVATHVITPTLTFALPSGPNGVYSATMWAGVYTVTVSHPLRQPVTVAGVTVELDGTTTVDFQLDPVRYLPLILNSDVARSGARWRLFP